MSSSSSNTQWIYDVFLNFTFVSHLYAALSEAGINTFIDTAIHKGTDLAPELVRGIQVVVPVFYDVDPSDVRHQTGAFGERLKAFALRCLLEGEGRHDLSTSWKGALMVAANIAGWDARNRSERDLVNKIVEDILERLDIDLLSITKFPVGLEARVQQVIEFINGQSDRACVVGIWGMGGLGKTTIAKVIYIREVCEKDSRGCIYLQQQLLSDLPNHTKDKIHRIAMGITMIEKRLCGKKALIVLDDVTELEQLKALCGYLGSIASGSVTIITTRDVRLLNVLKVNHMVHIYRIKEMDENESLELLSWHAFRQASPREDLIKLSMDIVAYCGGLPLALEVLGSYLSQRTNGEWESVLSKLKKIPDDQVQEKLKISYDGLDCEEKNVFLDICFFFIGKDRADVTEILKGCDLHPEIGITILVERSLIKLEKNNKLKMHDLLRDMGREIIRQSSPEEPEKRSRLWFRQEVLDVLSEYTGTKAIEGLALKLQRTSGLHFNTKAFEKMKKLRLLQLDLVQLVGNYEYLNKNLRWVCWQRFPLKHIPGNLYQGKCNFD